METTTTPKTAYETAREREIDILKAIASCGYLSTRLVALRVWLNSSEHVARNRAQLVLRRLEQKGLVLKKLSPHTGHLWILTRRGADEVNAYLSGKKWARDGHDLGFTRLQKDQLVIERGIEMIKNSDHPSALFGRSGIRGALPKEYQDCDAVFIELVEEVQTLTGLIAVVDARQSLVDRVVKLQKKTIALEFVGDEHLIWVLLKRVAQASD